MMERDWSLVTAVSSVIGVIGGLISVTFLIYEVRHSAHAIEGATVQALMALEADVFGMIAKNAELYLKGAESPEDLTPSELLRFDRIIAAQSSLYYSAYVQLQEGLIDAEVWDAYHAALKFTLEKPGINGRWQDMKFRYPRSFRDVIAA